MSDISATEFAAIYEVSKQRVTEMIALGMPAGPAVDRGKPRMVNTRAAIDWLIEREAAKYRSADDGETREQAELRKARADADFAEIKAAIAANEVVPLADAESLIERVIVMVAGQLDGIGGRVAATVAAETDAAVCRQIIFNECRQIRAAMAAEFEARAAVAQGADGDSPASGEDAGPVGGPVPDSAQG